MTESGFWDNPDEAQSVMKDKKSLEARLEAYRSIEKGMKELPELMDIAEELEDADEARSIVRSWESLKEELENLKLTTLLGGKYDMYDAILSIHAGTGGVDAMDWAEMLERMYMRYSEKRGFRVKHLDRQDDTAAGDSDYR